MAEGAVPGSQHHDDARRTARRRLGDWGEQLASQQLATRGYHILTHNFCCRYGEIDIIAEYKGILVFVEVKTRRGSAYGLPEEAITPRKIERMLRTIHYYLNLYEKPHDEDSWRIDVVAVQLDRTGRFQEMRIYPQALDF